MARFRSIFGKLFRALGDWLSDRTPQRSSLEYDAQQMLQGLDLKADATSFAMARADDLHEKLQAEVENCESLDREAAKFLSEDHEQEAVDGDRSDRDQTPPNPLAPRRRRRWGTRRG